VKTRPQATHLQNRGKVFAPLSRRGVGASRVPQNRTNSALLVARVIVALGVDSGLRRSRLWLEVESTLAGGGVDSGARVCACLIRSGPADRHAGLRQVPVLLVRLCAKTFAATTASVTVVAMVAPEDEELEDGPSMKRAVTVLHLPAVVHGRDCRRRSLYSSYTVGMRLWRRWGGERARWQGRLAGVINDYARTRREQEYCVSARLSPR